MTSTAAPSPHKSTNVRPSRRHNGLRTALTSLGAVSPTLAAHALAHLFRRPTRHQRPEREHAWLLDATSIRVRTSVGEVAAWTWGEGPTVVLLHGWEGRGSQLGAFVRPLRDLGFRVVALDGPAHGASDGQLATPPDFAAALSEVGRIFGPLHAVVAHSFGTLATQVALAQGLAVDRVVYVSTSFPPSEAMRRAASLAGVSDAVRQQAIAVIDRQAGTPVAEVERAFSDFDPGVPMLLVHDEGDTVCTIAQSEALADRASHARLLRTRGLGHHRILRDPDVVRAVAAFLADTTPEALAPRSGLHAEMARL